ncbi:MAG: hypothetical protein LBQ66_06555 [Planctomycetaceae bacterium]|jgi:hypothetical protein|nr:hypothetical protein [Planctomycetaceae bacterium]
MDMHLLMSCDIVLENHHVVAAEDKINYMTDEVKAKELFFETINILHSECYLFEKRGFYSNIKVEQLIKGIKKTCDGAG